MKRSAKRAAFARLLRISWEISIIVAGALILVLHPRAGWVEQSFINGYYPHVESALNAAMAQSAIPAGELILLFGIVGFVWRALVLARRRRQPLIHRVIRAAVDLAALAALFTIWFYAAWGWSYDRARLTERVRTRPTHVERAVVAALSRESIDRLNRFAGLAHAQPATYDSPALAVSVEEVSARLGSHGPFQLAPPKRSLFDWYLRATGIGGYVNPYSYESIASSDVFWFERPEFEAHEWAHLAGFAREDEANYVAVLACLRSRDPRVQYSGWLQLFLYLPRPALGRRTFVPDVWRDFQAIRRRNAAQINPWLSRWQWQFYSGYLHANRIRAGVASYSEFVQLYLRVRLDGDRLPIPVEAAAKR